MTDHSAVPGRIDLRTLVPETDPADIDRIMANVFRERALDTKSMIPALSVVCNALIPQAVPLAAAAVILLVLSLAALTLPAPVRAIAPRQTLSTWMRFNHVPTNGELLSTFEGYDQ